jgi:hypothetical protein
VVSDRKEKEGDRARLKLYQKKTSDRTGPEATGPDPGETPAQGEVLPESPSDEPPERLAEERALGLGLKPFRTVRSEHFVAVGNAPEGDLRIAMKDCEAVARDFMEYYKARAFFRRVPGSPQDPRRARGRAGVRTLLNQPKRMNNLGRTVATGPIAGIYDRNQNWLVLQDFRNVPRSPLGTS